MSFSLSNWNAVALLWASSIACSSTGTSRIETTVFLAKGLEEKVRSLPSYAQFNFSGLTFSGDDLFLGTNVGLLQLEKLSSLKLIQFRDKRQETEGPWSLSASPSIWLQHVMDSRLTYFSDGAWWSAPSPSDDVLTLGDLSEPFWMASREGAPLLVALGKVWSWSQTSEQWGPVFTNLPGKVFRVISVGDVTTLVVRNATHIPAQRGHYADELWSLQGSWRKIDLADPEFFVLDVIANAGKGYVLSDRGNLYSIDHGQCAALPIPGFCEAMTRTHDGKLLVSIRKEGVFELQNGEWRRLFSYPMFDGVEQSTVFLAESQAIVAFASAMTVTPDNSATGFHYSGSTGLWISRGESWDCLFDGKAWNERLKAAK